MNNLDIFENTFGYFAGNRTYELDQEDNCSANCLAKISRRLPFWINNKPFWTYRCKCCSTYKFEEGKVGGWDD